MIYSVSEEGVAALRALASGITEAHHEIINSSAELLNFLDGHPDTIGPHRASIYSTVRDIVEGLKASSDPVEAISAMLNEIADGYEEIVEDDRIRVTNNADNQSFYGGQTANGEALFAGGVLSTADIGEMENGTAVVKGEHFQQFLDDYYSSEESVFEPIKGSVLVETVSPSQIEGVHLGDREAEDLGVFWGMHASNKEFYIETASHIPEVQAALGNGRSLSELKEDPVVGKCASLYFDPENIPRVEKNNGYYTFDGDGRHRILAARELGYDIPVRIVGIRSRR